MPSSCSHHNLVLDVSPHARNVAFHRPPFPRRLAASRPTGRLPPKAELAAHDERAVALSFPGPLVLPGDDLACDPRYPPQSLRSWIQEKDRNRVTAQRNVIYVAAPPAVSAAVGFVGQWATPAGGIDTGPQDCPPPKAQDVADYLAAFYHGFPVRPLPEPFEFAPWSETADAAAVAAPELALRHRDTLTRIRTRARSSSPSSPLTPHQLNLNDLLDVVIDAVPADGYALLLLVDHDLYEDDDDEFCCGRAYGGSRAAVVSSARYRPADDDAAGVDRLHAWPASHCAAFVRRAVRVEAGAEAGTETTGGISGGPGGGDAGTSSHTPSLGPGPMHAAVLAASSVPADPPSAPTAYGLWLSRLCRTASHELAHCLGLDHCVYHACVMQGSAGLAEDNRQPPYLCPVCLVKLARAVGEHRHELVEAERAWARERDGRIEEYCRRWEAVGMWAGLGAWTRGRLGEGGM